MLPPKLRHILYCLALKEKNVKKCTLRRSNHLLKLQWEINFLTFLNIDQNASNRNMDILISNLLSKSILDFGKWSNGKYTNMRICAFSV